jgi:aldehyde dehydrogenase (NAD+)
MSAVSKQPFGGIRDAQSRWALVSVRQRMRFLPALRRLIAENALALASLVSSPGNRPPSEKLASELLPLADACRWLERNAARVLAPRRHGWWGRPSWLMGAHFQIQRQPFGIVLVIGPGNYPLFLPAVQALHALIAGNAVRLKPAPGTRQISLAFAELAFKAGLDPHLLEVLDDTDAAAQTSISDGAEKVVFTGSSANGRDILARLALTNTPSVMELSGEDAVLILPDADIELAARALRFGTELNAGNTCIAPRQVYVCREAAQRLSACLPSLPHKCVVDETEAITCINAAEFALGASIFSRDVARARKLAARIKTGFVLINDLIVPTADPRMPFGGVKGSGFGVTRGAEGLLEMTSVHVVGERRGNSHPHLGGFKEDDVGLFSAYIRLVHGQNRLSALSDFCSALIGKITRPSPAI